MTFCKPILQIQVPRDSHTRATTFGMLPRPGNRQQQSQDILRRTHAAQPKPVQRIPRSGGGLLRVATCGRHRNDNSNGPKEKPPPLPVRVFRDKAPGGDLLLHGKTTLPSAHA
ncbi:MAG TPA: hypothetical protein VIL60_00165, partial [Rhodanobacter sp.]